jgi:hypothetical protein
LGVSLTSSNLKNIDWDFLDAKMTKKLDAWICDSASSGASLTFLDSCLSRISSYYMEMFILNKTFVDKLYKHWRIFFGVETKIKRLLYGEVEKEFVDLDARVVSGCTI